MAKTVVITQSNYIPWIGYFDLIRRADELILLDGVQFTRRDWRNRNTIKTPNGAHWLTIPVQTKGSYHQTIAETRIAEPDWGDTHIRSIDANYRRAAAYEDASPWLYAAIRQAQAMPMLSDANRFLIETICGRLKIATPIRFCHEVLAADALAQMDASARLVALARAAGATRYLSGPAAKAYLDTDAFAQAGLDVAWMSYGPYDPYPQCWGPFLAPLSVIDLLLNCGDDRAAQYLANTP